MSGDLRMLNQFLAATLLMSLATDLLGQSSDCNHNGIDDSADIASGVAVDCNGNGIPDSCELSFAQDRAVTASGIPLSLAAADFNADGKTDLVYADRSGNTVIVLLGDGAGGFTGQSFTVGVVPVWLATGDFNGDGRPDVATVNAASNTVSVLLNTKATSGAILAVTQTVQVGFLPTYIVGADFDGDGDVDLATTEGVPGLQGTVHILLNNGQGSFTPGTPQSVGSGPLAMAAGDFDGDGKPDLAVANETSNNLSILLTSGATPDPTQVTFGTPVALAAGDFDGDGRADLAVANFNSSRVLILRSSGNGAFTAGQELTDVTNPTFILARDIDGDGRLDLLVSGTTGMGTAAQSTVAFYSGLAGGQFQLTERGTLPGSFNSLTHAVLSGSSRQVVALDDQGVQVVLLKSAGPACSETPPPVSTPPACGAGTCGTGGAAMVPLTLAGLMLMRAGGAGGRRSR